MRARRYALGQVSLNLYIQDEDPVPFSFHISLPAEAQTPGAPTRIAIAKSIEEDVLSHPSHAFTPEDVFVIHCSPQAVFKVRPATRCSSTLSGTHPCLLYAAATYLLSKHGICSQQVPGTAMRDCGISPPRPRMFSPATEDGCCVSTGKRWKVGSSPLAGMTGTSAYGIRSEDRATERPTKMGHFALLGAHTHVRSVARQC